MAPVAARRRTRVLVLHHTGGLNGSLVSLRELLRFVDRDRFEPVVALLRPGEEARRAIEELGVPTVAAPGIVALNHATAFWSDLTRPQTLPPIVETALGWRRARAATLRTVREVTPDVVHVNSVVLAPSADALRRARVPFVWHVRETPVRGHLGLRLRFQRGALVRWPDEVLFLSETARRAWIADARGVVVPELVDPARFDPSLDRAAARRALGVPEHAPVVLFVGGMAEIKGILPLLGAIPRVAREVAGARFVMPGAAPGAPGPAPALVRAARALGLRTAGERLEAAFAASGAEPSCLRLPFSGDVPGLLAACDLLVFPATEDHFPRPVVEAGFMERPVVASRLPMIAEAVREGETGLLVPPGDPAALADAIVALLRDAARRRTMAAAGRAAALRKFDARGNTRATEAIWERLAGAPRAGDASRAGSGTVL
jgi:glycosyltransferase involved in cell wall biosynthesis